jgi:Spy/CpxP family protein refolding chaperone
MFKKLFFISITLLLIVNTFAIAQMRMSHEDRLKQYSERLKLNDKQTKVVDSLLTISENKFQDINTDDMSQRRVEMRKIMDETNKQIELILTADQKPEFQKMQEERRARMNGQGQGAPPPPTN